MNQKIIYKLSDGVINPRYVGLLREAMPDKYDIHDYAEAPPKVKSICGFFAEGGELTEDAEIIDCSTEDDIYTIFFDKLSLDDRTMLYFFFCIQCDEEEDIVFTIESHGLQRLWLNGEMVFLCGRRKRHIHTLHLLKGLNVFCFQQHDSIHLIKTTFRIRSLKADKEDEISLTDGNLYYEEGLIESDIPYMEEIRCNGEDYHFILYPIDCVNVDYDAPIHLTITDHISGNVLYEKECRLHERCTVPTKNMEYSRDSPFNYLELRFTYKTSAARTRELKDKLFLKAPENFIKPVQNRIRNLLAGSCSDEERYYLKYVISLEDENEDIDTFNKWERIEKVVSVIERGEYNRYLRSEGEKVICYYSDIDDTINYYTATLPKGYDQNRKYPLLIINNVLKGTWLSSFFSRPNKIEAIAVDFDGRGITLGSYTGDAAFNEIFRDVLQKYSVDDNKICMLGHSNGGYATWAQAQAIPHRYSAIFPAVSEPNRDMIMNLCNMSVRYLTSESDFLNSKVIGELEENAEKYIDDYKTLSVEKYNHSLFGQIHFSEKILSPLLKASRNPYPNEIYFFTDKNRYRRSYWIVIHSIEFSKTYARIHAAVCGNRIDLSLENASGVTVTIPPQVSREDGEIVIDGISFAISGNAVMKFVKKDSQYYVSDNEAPFEIYKGTGVIDPFTGPVRIVSFLSDGKSQILDNFRTPGTNGFYGGVYAQYPVLDQYDTIPNANLVVLDRCAAYGKIANLVRNSARIKTGRDGYSYMGKSYAGRYIIMQIMRHPEKPDGSVLYVNTNDEELYEKCFFTRKLVLPTYSSGYYPYLNCDALIYDGTEYSTILEYGCDIKKME